MQSSEAELCVSLLCYCLDLCCLYSTNRVRVCRHLACIDMVQQKNGPDCAAVLRAMLHATISYETQSKVSHLSVMTVSLSPSTLNGWVV